MRKVLLQILVLGFGGLLACTTKDEIVISQPAQRLLFSQDTVLFDTLFSTVESITEYLYVYNPNDRAVNIQSIELGEGESSSYNIYVSGSQGASFSDLILRGEDSLLILVDIKVDPRDNDLPFLVEDSLIFAVEGAVEQNVKLITWGRDAYFLKGKSITSQEKFTANRPYVIMDSLVVSSSGKLVIDPGAELYFDNDALLKVDGTLEVNGAVDEQVLFRSARMDGRYLYNWGQWQGIYFGEQSKNNVLNHAVIRNAVTGVSIYGSDTDTIPDLTVSNTYIRNMARNALLAIDADIEAYNVVIDSCGSNLIRQVGTGYSKYTHCTLYNYPGIDTAVVIQQNSPELFALDQPFVVTLRNNIIWSDRLRSDQLRVVTNSGDVQVQITNNLLRSQEESLVELNILNENPQFVNSSIQDFRLDSVSIAIDQGIETSIIQDIEGLPRDSMPDLGAYEYKHQ